MTDYNSSNSQARIAIFEEKESANFEVQLSEGSSVLLIPADVWLQDVISKPNNSTTKNQNA